MQLGAAVSFGLAGDGVGLGDWEKGFGVFTSWVTSGIGWIPPQGNIIPGTVGGKHLNNSSISVVRFKGSGKGQTNALRQFCLKFSLKCFH